MIIHHISSFPMWKNIFIAALNHCDQFEVFYPNGDFDEENPLMTRKLDFEKLENISKSPWDGMDNSVCIRGNITKISKDLIYESVKSSFIGDKPDLWHFQLFKEGELLLTVADFTVCHVEDHPDLLSLFVKNGIEIAERP
ncbi:hypothetical protein J2Z40_002963 [Cytobacillus eiseniae]|uniref:Uncharacterized protein n=1 Tax=Cytobacillus eiseniae TaxID=762947 RepID=A0ABS4RI38_9BACI|nr:hypothetical protein [Cytobacillus eiseniae]MBP2242389.1 hypothetical protein [Cytobacillus eiseniae]